MRGRKQRYIPAHKPRIAYLDLADTYFSVDGCLYNVVSCSDDLFKEALSGYRERFPAPLDAVTRWELLLYSKVPIFNTKDLG